MDKIPRTLWILLLGAMGFSCDDQSLEITMDPDARLLRYSLATIQTTKKTPLMSRHHRRHRYLRPPSLQMDQANPFDQSYTLESGVIRLQAIPSESLITGEACGGYFLGSTTRWSAAPMDTSPAARKTSKASNRIGPAQVFAFRKPVWIRSRRDSEQKPHGPVS